MREPTTGTKELFARRHLGRATGEDLIAWAVALLEGGSEARNVGILAGLTMREAAEAEEYFRRSLRELGWAEPARRESLLWYARESAAKILRGEVTPSEGCSRIYGVVSALGLPRDLLNWSCLYLGHSPEPPCDDLSDEEYDKAVRREAARLLEEKP